MGSALPTGVWLALSVAGLVVAVGLAAVEWRRVRRLAAVQKARDGGETAYAEGLERSDNPYEKGSRLHRAWLAGWLHADLRDWRA